MKINVGFLRKIIKEVSDKTWSDSPDGVKAFAAEFIENYDNPDTLDLEFIPDPEHDGVWLLIDYTTKRAFTIYLKDNDFEGGEEVFEKASRLYGRDLPPT